MEGGAQKLSFFGMDAIGVQVSRQKAIRLSGMVFIMLRLRMPAYLFYETIGWQAGRYLWLKYVRQKITPQLRYTVTVLWRYRAQQLGMAAWNKLPSWLRRILSNRQAVIGGLGAAAAIWLLARLARWQYRRLTSDRAILGRRARHHYSSFVKLRNMRKNEYAEQQLQDLVPTTNLSPAAKRAVRFTVQGPGGSPETPPGGMAAVKTVVQTPTGTAKVEVDLRPPPRPPGLVDTEGTPAPHDMEPSRGASGCGRRCATPSAMRSARCRHC
jgi:hypothetical protein